MRYLQSPAALYGGLALCVVLLAPYAGCHLLLTKKPDPITDSSKAPEETRGEPDEAQPTQKGRIRPPEGGSGRLSNSDSLADIEQLLHK